METDGSVPIYFASAAQVRYITFPQLFWEAPEEATEVATEVEPLLSLWQTC